MQRERHKLEVEGARFSVEVVRRRAEPPTAPRLVVVCFLASDAILEMTRACLESIRRFTRPPYELWLVDNASPPERRERLLELEGVNLLFNLTPPAPPRPWYRRPRSARAADPARQLASGSRANAVGLELAAQLVDPGTQRLCVMHNDVLALRDDWLGYLDSKLDGRTTLAGVSRDPHPERVRAPHVSGLLLDFARFRELGLSFLPGPPNLDVGDRMALGMRRAGHAEFVCANTVNEPETLDWLRPGDPWRRVHADRAFDDERRLLFAHLGRGTPKGSGSYLRAGRTGCGEWLELARKHVLA